MSLKMKSTPNKNRYLFIAFFMLALSYSMRATEDSNSLSLSINCPPDISINCHSEIWNLSIYGNATYTYGYYTFSAGTPVVNYYLNSCNQGYITRTWTVEDYQWHSFSCTQTIFVSSSGPGGPIITWPEDVELSGCNPQSSPNQLAFPYNFPTWGYSECGMLGKTYSDMLFTVNDQCKKIMRTWKVMDWCQYSQYTGYKIYSYIQVIYLINNTPPVVNCPSDIAIESYDCQNGILESAPLIVQPGSCGAQFEISNNSPYAKSNGNNISGVYPIGNTKVSYTIKYACGRAIYCSTNVVVKNGAKPVPCCLGQLVTTLMGVDTDNDGKTDNGMVEVWAKDLNQGSHSLCGNLPLKYSFSKNIEDTYRVFTCDNIGANKVEVWVTDNKGAQNYCISDLIIQNNAANISNCFPKPTEPVVPDYRVQGRIYTLSDKALPGASIKLESLLPTIKYTISYDTTEVLALDSFINMSGYKLYRYFYTTNIAEKRDSTLSYKIKETKSTGSGHYLFDSLTAENIALRLSAFYSDSVYNYIDNNDVELLYHFIKGDISFSSFHQYLAADINEDGYIDSTDLSALASFVKREIAGLPGSHQWYVVNAKATFENPDEILNSRVPYYIDLDSVSKSNPDYNFIAFKKGDISIDPNTYNQFISEVRSKAKSEIQINISPNPFKHNVTFTIESPKSVDARLSIFNSNAQEIYTKQFNVSNRMYPFEVDLSNSPAGLLFWRLTIADNVSTGKLVHID